MTVTILREDTVQVMGDDLYEDFETWSTNQHISPPSMEELALLERWLLNTPSGDLALKRWNDWPKQQSLPFSDDRRPWRRD